MISVIVPVYNGQDYLEKCIDSIENQTYGNLEVIIVNDGSTDNTPCVCEELAKKYHNIQVINMNDEGVSSARNAGIGEAHGEYLTFVDADDRLLPATLQILYDLLNETGSDVAGCGFYTWHNEKQWQSQLDIFSSDTGVEPQIQTYDSEQFLADAILKGNSRCWSKLYKREVIGEGRFRRNLSIGEDMLFLVDLLSGINKVAETTYPGYGYYQNPNGAMNRSFLPKYMDQITCWEIARGEIIQIDSSLTDEVTAILLMAIMLTAGKIALLSGRERRQQKDYIRICHEKLVEALKIEDAYANLSGGYKVKTKFFAKMPSLYLWLYHFRKYKG